RGGARADQLERGEDRTRLVERTHRRRRDRHRGPPVAEHDHARRLVGEPLADDELVGAAGGGELRGRRPVHPGDVIARLVLARAGDVGADASPDAPHAAERETDYAPARDQREDGSGQARYTMTAAGTSRSMSKPGFGAIWMQRRRTSSLAACQPRSRISARKLGRNSIRCSSTGTNSRSTSSGVT